MEIHEIPKDPNFTVHKEIPCIYGKSKFYSWCDIRNEAAKSIFTKLYLNIQYRHHFRSNEILSPTVIWDRNHRWAWTRRGDKQLTSKKSSFLLFPWPLFHLHQSGIFFSFQFPSSLPSHTKSTTQLNHFGWYHYYLHYCWPNLNVS